MAVMATEKLSSTMDVIGNDTTSAHAKAMMSVTKYVVGVASMKPNASKYANNLRRRRNETARCQSSRSSGRARVESTPRRIASDIARESRIANRVYQSKRTRSRRRIRPPRTPRSQRNSSPRSTAARSLSRTSARRDPRIHHRRTSSPSRLFQSDSSANTRSCTRRAPPCNTTAPSTAPPSPPLGSRPAPRSRS